MSTRKLKQLSAGAFVGCAFGLFALGVAWGTPSLGLTNIPLVGPIRFNEIYTKSETDGHEVEIKTRGLSDVYVTHLIIAPGGHGGWHSHPGPSIISVKSGTATFYQATDPTTPQVYTAGNGFVEDAGLIHDVRNEGVIDLEIIVLQLVPMGATRRIDHPAPAGAEP